MSHLVDVVLAMGVQDRPGQAGIAELAARQHGVVARFQLLLMGFGRNSIQHWIGSGYLQPLHRGVYAVGHRKLTAEGRTMAALLACGEDAMASHRTAAWLHSLLRDSRSVTDVTLPGSAPARQAGIRPHRARALHPEDTVVIDGIPCTSVARTLLDVAASEPRRLERAMEEAERLGTFDLAAIERTCARCGGHRGLKPLRALIGRTHSPLPFTRSEFERRVWDRLRREDLPLPAVNTWVGGHEVDMYWAHRNVVVELDTRDYHAQRAAFETDRARDAKLLAAGTPVLRITGRRFDADEDAVFGELRALLA
ncbi:MAG TPA: type IV toxin-antitoxin system AbiEi family antitoxin domain-containing protein [Thermoleophilaceae bacterium]